MRMTHPRIGIRPLILAALAGAAATIPAHAQSRTWLGGSGSWFTPANWNPADAPDTAAETAILSAAGIYTVSVPGTLTIGGFSLSTPTASIAVDPGFELRLAGGSTNSGTVVINATGVNSGTFYRSLNSHTLSGSGVLRLNANAGNLDSAARVDNGGGQVLTNAAGHTIAGTGRVHGNLTNNGMVSADIGGATLDLFGSTKTNNSAFQALAGATLGVTSSTVNQGAAGSILADGGLVAICGSAINGGAVSAINGGLVRNTCTSNYAAVSTNGPLVIDAGTEMRVSSSLTNTGFITVNGAGINSGTLFRFIASTSLGGGGVITLNAHPDNLDSAAMVDNGGGQVLTLDAGTINGAGRIYSGVVNNGLISADVNGRTLQLFGSTKTNNATMRATAGGRLDLNSCTVNQAGGGTIIADNSPVTICSSTINGGTLAAAGTGRFTNTCTSTCDDVANAAPLDVAAGTEMRLVGSLVNSGTITVNPTMAGSGTLLRSLSTLSISGGGTIILNADPGNLDTAYMVDNGGGQVTTNADNTIRGRGRIYSNLINDGLVTADVSGGVLDLSGSTKTNRSVMRAESGGTLALTNVNLVQTTGPGAVQALGGLVSIAGATITGGSISASGPGGLARNAATSLYLSTTISGPFEVAAGTEMRLGNSAALTNNGTITVNPTSVVTGTLVRALATNTIAGSGQIVLAAHPSNLDTAYFTDNGGGQVTTNGPSHTIRGVGRIYANFTNNGTVLADVPGALLQASGSTKTNNALMAATSGGQLDFTGLTLNQGLGGLVRADAGSLVTFCSSTVNDGVILAMPGGECRITCTSTVNDSLVEGVFNVTPGNELRTAGGFTNNGTVTINQSAANLGTLLRCTASMTIDGSGTLRLNAHPANLDTAYITDNGGGQVFTNAPGHTVSGLGRFYGRVTNNGILSPGDGPGGVGRFEAFNVLNSGETADFRFDISGPGNNPASFDRITSNSPITVNGTLYARAIGYTPSIGETFDIIVGASRAGTFDVHDTSGFDVVYLANGVRLVAICEPDVNQDGNVDQDDVTYLINVIGGGDNPTGIDPDFNRDGNVDQDDITTLINAVAGGGC
jgi:hypothetical protein